MRLYHVECKTTGREVYAVLAASEDAAREAFEHGTLDLWDALIVETEISEIVSITEVTD